MEFFAYYCECGYMGASPSTNPKCPDCGKDLVEAKKGTKKYQEINMTQKKQKIIKNYKVTLSRIEYQRAKFTN